MDRTFADCLRVGHGYDVHALAPGLRLRLCGVDLEHDRGCVAHSDGDVAVHALCDALLGAAALGDIGLHFPDTAAEYAGIDSMVLLERCMELLAGEGFGVVNADVTIAVMPVPMEEASRFGIMSVDGEDMITEFAEKPRQPKSNLASMGIYIFNWKLLRKMLLADMKNQDSNHDFGKDIIPTMLNDGRKLYAYKFKGYWKDVGTIDSLWEANIDLINSKNELDLNDDSWKIYTEDTTVLPQYVGPTAEIERAFINQGCVINGKVKNSVLFTGARVGEGAQIIDSVLMPGVEVEEGAVVTRALVADGVKIGKNAVVGSADSEHIELVSKRVKGDE